MRSEGLLAFLFALIVAVLAVLAFIWYYGKAW